MELILENKYNKSIILGNYKNEYILEDIEDSSIPIKVNSTKGISQDGENYINSELEKRQIKITIGIKGNTPEEIFNKKSELQRILNPKLGLLKITYSNYSIHATIDNYPKYKRIDNLYHTTTINFLCLIPLWEKESYSGGSINAWVKNTEFPINFIEGYTENLIDGTDFTKDTTFSILDSGNGTLTQDKTAGTITIKNNAAAKNGLVTTNIKGGLEKGKDYTFAIDADSTVSDLDINIISEDTGQSIEDGLTYGWNCQTKLEDFVVRDYLGNPTYEPGILIGTKICVLWCNLEKQLLQIEYRNANNEYKQCWITNDPTCLEYRYKDMFINTSGGNLTLYYGDLQTTTGSLAPNEKATILYKFENRYCVIYNGANPLSKSGVTTFNGAPNFLNEDKIATIKLGKSGMTRSAATIKAGRTHKNCKLSITNAVKDSVMSLKQPKLEVGTVANPWNPSFNDDPQQSNGIELGYQDPEILKNFINKGDVDTDVVATFKINGPVLGPYLLNVTTGKKIKLKGDLQQGDIIKVDIERKKVYLTNSKFKDKISYQYIDNATDWDFSLITGDNVLKFDADFGKQNIELFIEYKEKFVEVF